DAVEELEQIALRRIERQVPNIEPGRGYFDCFRLARGPRRFRTVGAGRLHRPGQGLFAAGEKCRDFLPERFLRRCARGRTLVARAIVAPSAGAAAWSPAVSP